MKIWIRTIVVTLALVAPAAHADWHGGKVTQMNIGYDGSTVTFVVAGWSRVNCYEVD